jgi:drug/metabolite transporter (DMT)-like permease
MFWALLSAIGACTNASYYIANKKFLQRIDPDVLAAAGFLGASVILLVISFLEGIPPLGPLFLPAVIVSSAINIVATLLTFRALASTDISLAIPMISFTPIFLVGTAALILHELPSLAGIAGIVIIVTGSYILNMTGEQTSITDPFRSMAAHPGVVAMLVVSFLYAVGINFDKIAMQNSNTLFGSCITFLLIGLAFVLITFLRRNRVMPAKRSLAPEDAAIRSSPASLFRWREVAVAGILIGFLATIEAVTINTAYTQQITPYVIAIKRLSILIVVLYGAFVFHEKEIVRRLSGASLMVLGAVLILLFP